MAFCKDCVYWRKSTPNSKEERVGVCQLDGKEKDDIRYACVIYTPPKPVSSSLKISALKR